MRFCTACGHSWDGHARAVPGCIVEDCPCTEYGHAFAGPEVECTCGYLRRGHAIAHDEGCPLWVDQFRNGPDVPRITEADVLRIVREELLRTFFADSQGRAMVYPEHDEAMGRRDRTPEPPL